MHELPTRADKESANSTESQNHQYVQVYKGAVLEHQISLEGEPTSWEYTLKEPESKYRIVVKVQGMLKEKPYGQSDEIYSLGQTVSIN